MWGLTEADYPDEVIGIFPENWQALDVFMSLSTQWRVGAAGPTGIDYNVLPPLFRMKGIPRKEWPDVLEAIQVMEDKALSIMHETKK